MNSPKDWFELGSDIRIEALGMVQKTNLHPSRQGVPYWILVLVEKGQRTLYANHQPLCVGAHQFFLLPPFTDQKPFQLDEHTACYVHFHVTGEACKPPVRIDPLRTLLPTYGYLPTDLDCFSHLRYLCDHALTPYANEEFLAQQLAALLKIMSLHCQKNPNEKERKGIPVNALAEFIKENACRPLSSLDYEEAFGKSYHHINLLFKQQFGVTVKQYHAHLRMQYAAQMLLSGLSIQKAAAECGFDDYYFFINSFTKEHGIPPAAYRKRNGG